MAKRHFVLKSALTLMLSMLSVSVSAYDIEVDGMYYNVLSIDNLTVEVTSGENKYSGNIVVPLQISFKDRIFKVIRIIEAGCLRGNVAIIKIGNDSIKVQIK